MTLYFLHFFGKGDENCCGLLSLETPQGPGMLRTCPASQAGKAPTAGKWSVLKYTCANQCHRGLAVSEQGERRGREGVQGLPPLAHSQEGEQGQLPCRPAWLHLAPRLTYSVLLEKRESPGLAGSPLVSRKGGQPAVQPAPRDLQDSLD